MNKVFGALAYFGLTRTSVGFLPAQDNVTINSDDRHLGKSWNSAIATDP